MEYYSHLVVIICTLYVSCFSANSIYIEDNTYKGISISFYSKIVQQQVDFEKLKAVLTKSSDYLYSSTRNRSYYGEFIVSVPSTWTTDWCKEYVQEAPRSIDVYITESLDGSILRAQHSKGCGSIGDIIYMSLAWLQGNNEDLSLQFVQQWSIFRYGVFEENAAVTGSCFASSKKTWSPVGCYNSKIEMTTVDFEDGLPVCSLPDDFFQRTDLKSSLMFMNNLSKVLDYCDGSSSFPHNPVMPTLHNNLCQGKPVWSVITNSEDFARGKNLPRSEIKPPVKTAFKCFREPAIQVTFAVQNSSSTNLREAVDEMRYSFYHFLLHVAPRDAKVNLLTFSNKPETEAHAAVDLDVSSKDLYKVLNEHIRTRTIVDGTCLICGLQKALNASQENKHPFPIVVLIAWESALIGEKVTDILAQIQSYPTVIIHLVLVEDTEPEVLSPELVDAIRATGGHIYYLPKEYVLMSSKMNVILANIMKSPLHLEDKIVVAHEATFINTTNGFVDSFVTPKGAIGKLLYIMHCNPNGLIEQIERNCTLMDPQSSTYKCGKAVDLKEDMKEENVWKYSYEFQGGPISPVCSSIAILSLTSISDFSYTLRGWLSSNTIIPGDTALIIYAEIVSSLKQRYRVAARISGPGIPIPIEIELRDNGNGDPDTKRGDGIFSRYFTSFREKGTFVVSIFSELEGVEEAMFARDNTRGTTTASTQTKIIGSFIVLKKPPTVDIIPPNRICDLRVISVDHNNSTVVLQWTAPGDDHDHGSATKYEIKYSTHWTNLLELTFNNEENALMPLYNYTPRNSGLSEKFQISFPKNSHSMTYYIALRAIDEKYNNGPVSNIAQVYLQASQTIVTETEMPAKVTTQSPGVIEISTTNETSTPVNTTETTLDLLTTDNVTNDDNSTAITDKTLCENCLDKHFVIIVTASGGGGILLLIIIINIIVCCCCIRRKHPEEPKRLSRKASMRPPYNLNVAFKRESQSSFQSDDDFGASVSRLEDQNVYSKPQDSSNSPTRYSYHTSRSLLNKENNQTLNKELGFKVVTAMPAYATSSLSRYATRLNADDNDSESEVKSRLAQPQKPSTTSNTEVYPLGVV